MNPAIKRVLLSLITRGVTVLGTILVTKGWLTDDQVSTVVGPLADELLGLAMVIGTALYGVVRGWTDRQKIVTALASTKPMSEHELEAQIRAGVAAPVTTPPTVVPKAVVQPPWG